MITIISEFVAALDEEIVALKAGRGGGAAKVFNGKLIRKVSNGFVYLFHLENFLATIDDAPAEIEINGQRHPAQILSTQGLEVEVYIENYCGDLIADGKLLINLWYLLELLKKKFLESGNNSEKFKLSNALFSGNNSEFPKVKDNNELRFSPSIKNPPNQAQEKAIKSSFYQPLSIIWGPPGTGKTTTIAKAIEAHLNAGRKVLLVSHANNAVDQALLDVAEQMKNTDFYNNGELLRLGTPADNLEKFEENYEMVLIDRIANKLGASLVAEKKQLIEKKNEIQFKINELLAVKNLVTQVKALTKEWQILERGVRQTDEQLKQVHSKLELLNHSQFVNQIKLKKSQSAGILQRVLKGLNPEKIQKEIDKNTITLDSCQRQSKSLESQAVDFQNKYEAKKIEINELKKEGEEVSRHLGITSLLKFEEISDSLNGDMREVEKRMGEIDKNLDELHKNILTKAKLVATTLTKTFTEKKIDNLQFDVLLVDEASMAPLPYVYWAVSKCTQFVTIVGDFLQLPPIAVSDGIMSQKWLKKSIFDVLKITTVEEANQHPLVTLLDTQYRMVPDIAEIPKSFFYGGQLKNGDNTKTKYINDKISDKPLVLVKTDEMNPWCSRLSAGSRFNLYNALVCATLVKNIFNKGFTGEIGIVTPYAPQARLINKIAKDWGLENLHISTIHRFQGGEEPIIIFDTVEATGTKIAPMLDGTRADSDADLILNVAITRAESKFYLIGHVSHLLSELNPNSSLTRLLKYLEQNGEVKKSNEFVNNYLVTDFEKYTESAPLSKIEKNDGSLFTEKNFWRQFDEDLNQTKERLIILSPFLSLRRADHFMNRFQAMIVKGVEIFLFTKPKNQQSGEMAHQAEVVIDHMRSIGVKVSERSSMHQKVAMIDDKIAWEGSLNILSHRDTGEQMRRFEGQATIKELIKNLELDQDDATGNVSEKVCPKCGKLLVYRQSRFGKFLACSGYPRCKYIEKSSTKFKKSYRYKNR